MTTNAQNSKQFLGQQGSATVPSFSFLGYNTTGFYLPSANSVAIGTAGTERMRIDSSGNVGVGTSSPSYKLDVQQNGNLNATIGVSNTTAGTSSVARLIAISDAGNASFGFTSSSYTDITGAQDALLLNASNASGGMAFALDGVVKMKMDSSGNVGIGTASPSYKLDVSRASSGVVAKFTGTASAYIYGGAADVYFTSDTSANNAYGANSTSNYLNFYTNGSERVRIDSSGNVGIGTSSPNYQLQLYKAGASANYLQVTSGATGAASGNGTLFGVDASGNGIVTVQGAVNYITSVAGAERMRIDSSGKVSIGKTSALVNLDVLDQVMARPAATTGSGELIAAASDYSSGPSFTNTAIRQYGSTATGTLYGVSKAGMGLLDFINGTSAVIGSNASVPIIFANQSTERARIDSSGNFAIGTTSAAYKLTLNQGTSTAFGITKSGTGGWCRENYIVSSSGTYYFDYFGVYGSGSQLGYISSNGTTMTYGTSSDVRMKENIVDSPSALDDLEAVKIRSFDWKSNGHHQKFGVIAQELIDVVPDAVQKGQTEEDMWGVGYANLVPMLLKAVQELKAEIDALKGAK